MTSPLHPALRADWLVLRRTRPLAAVSRLFGAPVLLLAGVVGVAGVDFHAGYGWCLAAAALLALGGSHAIVHARWLGAQERWRSGWCGALPAARGAVARTLLLVTLGALLASLALTVLLLALVAHGASHRADFVFAWAGISLALVAGSVVAVVRAWRRGGRVQSTDGIREPLFAWAFLNDRRLPHCLDWQRRLALVRWRRGGGFAAVGVVLAAVPMGAPMLPVVGLVLLVASWTWLEVVMRASAGATDAMIDLLAATPLDPRRARRAALRYPALAVLCALVPMIAGASLSGPAAGMLAWAVGVCAVSVRPLVRMLRLTHGPDRSP